MTAGATSDRLYDREAELADIESSLSFALTGNGRVVLVQGPPGIGKTRLLEEACARAGVHATVLRSHGGELERNLPMVVARELFRPVVAGASEEQQSRIFAGAAGLSQRVFHDGSAELDPTLDTTYAVSHGLYWLTANLAEEHPLVLAVDDVHWADEATQRWLGHLIPRVGELPVLLLLTARPRELDPASPLALGLAREPDTVLVMPAALSAESTAELVRTSAGEADPEFCAAVHEATGGNPLLVFTLQAAVRARGLAPTADNAPRLGQLGTDWLDRVVLPRLHALGATAVDVARAAAVLGEGCSLGDAGELAGCPQDVLEGAVDALVVADILRPDRSLGFTHPLVRAAVLGELAPGRKSALHRGAARILAGHDGSAEHVAQHLVETDPVGEPWAVEHLRAAATLATQRGAPSTAAAYLLRVLDEPLDDQDRTMVLHDLGWAGFRSGDERARHWFEQALASASDPFSWMLCWLGLGNTIVMHGLEAPEDFGLDDMPELDDELTWALESTLLLDYGFSGRIHDYHPSRAALPEDAPDGDTPFQRMWLAAAAVRYAMAGSPAARSAELADRALGGGRLLAEVPDFSYPMWALMVLLDSGELERALGEAEAALADAVRRGSRSAHQIYSLARADARLRLGNLAEAEADVGVALAVDPDHEVASTVEIAQALYLEILLEQGRVDEAVAWRDGLVPRFKSPEDFNSCWLLQSRGMLLAAEHRPVEAVAEFRRCGDLLATWHAEDTALLRWRVGLARSLLATGQSDEARSVAENNLAVARRIGTAPHLGSALATLGVVLGGDAGIRHLREAVDVLSSSPARLALAHALCDLGTFMRHDRGVTEAREVLKRALDLAERCGAGAVASRAHDELLASGARPRRRAMTGADALTPSELRVARLAAEGLSNPEIAQALFVTRKTIEKHLGNAFLKLGVSLRSELAEALHR